MKDNDKHMYLVGYILKSAGHEVIEAAHGEERVRVATNENPNLVIIGIQLPCIENPTDPETFLCEIEKHPPSGG